MNPPGSQRRGAPRSRLPAIIGLGLAGLALGITLVAVALSGDRDRASGIGGRQASAKLFSGVPQEGARLGQEGAPVTIAVFTDLQCQPCRSWFLRTVPRLVEELVRRDRARLALYHYPFGMRNLTVSALAATAAGRQGRQWQHAYLLVRNLTRAPVSGLSASFMRRVARADPRLDVERWRRDQSSPTVRSQARIGDRLAANLELPPEPAVTVTSTRGSRELTRRPSAGRVLAAARRLGGG